MVYPCAKFGDFSFSHFVLSRRQTESHTDTESETRMIAILTRLFSSE